MMQLIDQLIVVWAMILVAFECVWWPLLLVTGLVVYHLLT